MRGKSQRDGKEGSSVPGAKTFELDLGSSCTCLVCLLVQVVRGVVFLYKRANNYYIRVCCEGKMRN